MLLIMCGTTSHSIQHEAGHSPATVSLPLCKNIYVCSCLWVSVDDRRAIRLYKYKSH